MVMFLRRAITHNWLLKIFSLALATLMWMAIWSGSNDQMERTVTLAFRNIPPNMEITGQTESQITLQLRGSFDVMAALSPEAIIPTISLAGEEPGPKSFTISPDNFDTPTGVEVFGVSPDRVEFNLERTILKDVEIRPYIDGNPADGFRLGDVIVTPPRIRIEGPESNLEAIEVISTVPIRIDGRTGSLSTSVNLDVPDTLFGSFAPVEVFVQILENTTDASFAVEPDPALSNTWTLGTETLEVTLNGPASEIERFTGEGVYFSFDPDAVDEDGAVAPTILGLPDSFEIVEVSPANLVVSPAR